VVEHKKQTDRGKTVAAEKDTQVGIKYLDMQAYGGITKHIGGREATDTLLALCHIENAHEVLNVGCGIGVSSAYIAKKYHCHVVGVDISEKMIEWSRKRARAERVEPGVEFRTADILELPFETNRFDAVIAESVVAFVEDKARAMIRECVRVTKPGGYVGLNESFFTQAPTPELAKMMRRTCGGIELPTLTTWQTLWDASGLQDRLAQTYSIDARREIRDRMQWIGARWALKAFARLFYLYLTRPDARASIKEQFGSGSGSLETMKYGLFVGRKQE
jgi:ubiquinone/menaquinone biosynthesis C-methylase UbiE